MPELATAHRLADVSFRLLAVEQLRSASALFGRGLAAEMILKAMLHLLTVIITFGTVVSCSLSR